MKPVICFYENNQFIYSTHYKLISCDPACGVTDFLNDIENQYFDSMKIVQINFEFENQLLFKKQKNLYSSAPAHVFILNEYQILTEDELLKTLAGSTCQLVFNLIENKNIFIEKIDYIKKQIALGRLYQVNLSTALVANCAGQDPLHIFKHFYSLFNGHYKAYLPLEQLSVQSFSPELFLNKKNGLLKTQPIKGSLAQNLNFTKNLIENEKEEAELSMIVDLLRNDFNRIEKNQNAEVTQHRAAMSLGYIQHTYSEVAINTKCSLSEILLCTLPGGSISGCPKIESLILLAEIESLKRQIYTGTIGWWKANDFCLNLAIRTFIQTDESIYYHAGCGIVYDSIAENEWNEFVLKTGKINALK